MYNIDDDHGYINDLKQPTLANNAPNLFFWASISTSQKSFRISKTILMYSSHKFLWFKPGKVF